jgi:hypothetical protein
MIHISNVQVAPGVFSVRLPESYIKTLKDLLEDPGSLEIYCRSIAEEIGASYIFHQVYDYEYVIANGGISQGSSLWHSDKDGDIDCLAMIYVVDPDLNKQTGMRVAFRDKIDLSSETYLDIKTGTAFFVRHDDERFEHCVEEPKDNIKFRACLSLSLGNYQTVKSNFKLQDE